MAAPKILSVDDSKMIQTLIGKGFSSYNVQLYFASNGIEGLAAAARELPDVIILDVTMPVMDGVECLMKLKSDSSLRDIPVIMLTAEAGKDNVLKIAKMGVRDYIVKPFTEQALIDRVSRVIDLKVKGSDVVKNKSIDDSATILVIDEHETIVESIRKGLTSMPWKIIGTDECGSASQMMAKEQPDIVLISLSLPNKAALSFYQTIRANFRSQAMPILGLSVKTAAAEQTECKNMGFNGVITKPIDLSDLAERLARAMNLDTSSRYFQIKEDVLFVKIPNGLSINGASDLTHYVEPKTKALVEAGMNRLIIDLHEVDRLEIYMIKLILGLVTNCRGLDIKFRLVGSSEFINQAKAYEEMTELQIFPSVEQALADFDK
ncbi:MAG: response regulator [Verrucomicrobiae bacterium]